MEALQRVLSNEIVDSDVKNVLQHLLTKNKQTDMNVAKLERQMRTRDTKINEIQRYQSGDCLIFRILQLGIYKSIINYADEFTTN